jgi:hypothetical protein
MNSRGVDYREENIILRLWEFQLPVMAFMITEGKKYIAEKMSIDLRRSNYLVAWLMKHYAMKTWVGVEV